MKYLKAVLATAIIGAGLGVSIVHPQSTPKMGPTFELTPGQHYTVTKPDGSTMGVTIEGGTMTEPPKGFVPSTVHGHHIECVTPHMVGARCRDGELVHYQNPTTGERLDILVRRTKSGQWTFTPLLPQSRLEIRGNTAEASIGDTFSCNLGTIDVIDVGSVGADGQFTVVFDLNGNLYVTVLTVA